jgi:hypothetical protein
MGTPAPDDVQANITNEFIELTASKIELMEISATLQIIMTRYDFIGFQPAPYIRSLLKKKQSRSITQIDFESDLVKMISMNLKIGNPNERNMARRSPEAMEDWNTLKTRYDLKVTAGGKDSTTITVPRTAAAFPVLTMRIAKILGTRKMIGPYQSRLLPWYMNIQVFPSCIPHSLDVNTRNVLLAAATAYSTEQSLQFPQNKGIPIETLLASQFKFVYTSYTSAFPPESLRMAYFKKLDVDKDVGTIMKVAAPIFELVEEISSKPRSIKAFKDGIVKAIEGKGKEVASPTVSPHVSDIESDEESEKDFGTAPDGSKYPAVIFYPPALSNKQKREFRKEKESKGFKGQFMDKPSD